MDDKMFARLVATRNRRRAVLRRAELNLREAAVAFANQGPVKDWRDSGGVVAHNRLRAAARRYAAAHAKAS